MEHWQKMTIGTLGGVVATFVFYFFMGKLLDYFYIKRKKKTQSEVRPRPERFYAKKQAHNAELERFVHEEFESSRHECVVVVGCTGSRSVGICAFLQDMRIEYFVESFPECCFKHFQQSFIDKDGVIDEAGLKFEAALRTALTAVSAWAPKWEMADSINFLCQNERFVLESNDPESHPAKFLKQFEDKFEFKIYSQWTDNFVSDHYANEEMWEGLIICLKNLLAEEQPRHIWSDFVCETWHRTKIHVNSLNFHQLPHPGQVTADQMNPEEKLVDI